MHRYEQSPTMHTELAQHSAPSASVEPVRVTLVMSPALKDRLQALAEAERRTLSAQCVVLIERSLAELSIAA